MSCIDSGCIFVFQCREMMKPLHESVKQSQYIERNSTTERTVMTVVAEKLQYANRNMRRDRKVGKECL